MPPFELETHVDAGEGRVLVRGDLDIATAPLLLAAARRMTSETSDVERVVADLGAVSFLDSSGLRALLVMRSEAGEAGREFAVALPRDRTLHRTFEVSRLQDVFSFVESRSNGA